MAKRKTGTPKVENLRPTNINDEQLEKVQQTVKLINGLHSEIGMLEGRKHTMLHSLSQAQSLMKEIQEELEKEYGKVDINVADGSIKYIEDEQADS